MWFNGLIMTTTIFHKEVLPNSAGY